MLSRGILSTLFANRFPASSRLSAASARARLYRSHQWIVSHSQTSQVMRTLTNPPPQKLHLSLAILGKDVGPRWGGCDALRCGSDIHGLCGNSEFLSQRGNTIHAPFDHFADGLVPHRSWRPRPRWNQRKCLGDRSRLCIPCTFFFSRAYFHVPRALM